MAYKYTLGFIRCGDHVLLLNRQKAPWMGRWNGVGGKLDEKESPYDCIVREAYEETGFRLEWVSHGAMTWCRDGVDLGGVYVFSSEVLAEQMAAYPTPRCFCHEGILDWKKLDWVLHADNLGVVDNVKIMLKDMFTAGSNAHWASIYQGNALVSCEYTPDKAPAN